MTGAVAAAYISGLMASRLGAPGALGEHVRVVGCDPTLGPFPDRARPMGATWALADGGAIVVEAVRAGPRWHVIVLGAES